MIHCVVDFLSYNNCLAGFCGGFPISNASELAQLAAWN